MNWDLLSKITTWDKAGLPAILSIAAVTLGFITYYFVMKSPKLEAKIHARFGAVSGQARWITYTRIFGGLALGIPSVLLPIIFLDQSPADYGMSFSMNKEAWILTAILCPLLVLINVFRAGKPKNLETYPQIRAAEWDTKRFAGSSIGWIVYLLGYELCFRGFLLFGCAQVMGIWPAIAINASIYSYAHFFKGIGETVGAIPFGIIISILSLWTGNFMVAFLVHCALALSNQTVSFLSHPDMKFKRA